MTGLYVDWDGTATARDTLHMVIEEFGDLEVFREMERRLERELTLDEVIATEMATISAPFDVVVRWLLDHVELRPGLAALVTDYEPVFVSAGFEEFIAPILARDGLVAPVIANTVVADPRGWRTVFRDSPLCVVCGERCKRGVIDGGTPFVYVGDGVSDRCVSLAATRLFARDGLARWLDAQGVDHEPFADLDDVVRALRGS